MIRKEAARNDKFYWRLEFHRKEIVRREARASMLAYGFLRGRPRHTIEPKSNLDLYNEKILLKRVEALVSKYCLSSNIDYYTDYCVASENVHKEFRQKLLENFKEWWNSSNTNK